MDTGIAFETGRLRLRQWRDEDLAPFAALNADAQVMRYFPAPLSRAESDAMAGRCRSLIAQKGWGVWVAERRADDTFLGFVGLHEPAATLPFAPCVEIAWRLARHAWGQGYATEAARGALAYGFGRLGLDEIVAFTTLANARSRAVMERLGMRQDAVGFDHPALPPRHPLRPHCLYRLPRAAWQAAGA
ncbi:GNAT family N-acetyltransferase [Cupriavidus alkaliphilus]|uniref:RimJ/RimL family protein N-acetyltransferase n=1 Tax=Cupriavidus alkaliphilus TaxID=942866 RepID=A0A7W4V8D0_9BURK|nr:GNAT family N-acetyltransferase [Cupriavidus alkaliphilus]MBB3006504.1 RimJ/RimL family protein N-acetyltransferase [Cupriavidus alkaliphilus]SCB15014.1 Protein N-acetyltransferase, RimJ/RimL family [Cupriavidus alkaliphilus]